MALVSLKDYAKVNGITYEAVRQQVVRYTEELGEHIIKDGRQQFLDDIAVEFLNGKRQKNPVTIIQMEKDEKIEILEENIKKLLTEKSALEAEYRDVLKWKAEKAIEIASLEYNKALLEDKNQELEEKEALYVDAKKQVDELFLKNQLLENELSRPLTWIERITGKRKL